MATHRASYWKSTALSLAAACGCLIFFIWARLLAPPAAFALLASLLGAVGFATFLAVAAGGLICLWRDALEKSGKNDPLLHYALWEPASGLLKSVGLRFLHGSRLRPGDVVQVRPRHEIEKTLDDRRTYSGLPFMPEMEHLCGRVFRVHRRVDHINDMRKKTGLRRLRDAVTLSGVRCSGAAHDECEAECQILWKDVWLKRLPNRQSNCSIEPQTPQLDFANQQTLTKNTDGTYFCQMTALWEATRPMSPFDVRQDLRPLASGNIRFTDFLLVILTHIFNVVQRVRGGIGYPYMPVNTTSESVQAAEWQLGAGDTVEVRSKCEISRTLRDGKTKGLWFDRDMIRFCGQRTIVRKSVTRIIHESTAKMVVFKTPCVVLEGVIATGEFLRMCPQHEYIFWRAAWLSRSEPHQQSTTASSY